MTFLSTDHGVPDQGAATAEGQPTVGPVAKPPPPHEAELLIPFDDYVAYRPNVFPSPTSGQWFVRHHRAALIAAGALLRPCGRNLVQPQLFDAYVLQVGKHKALAAA